MSFSVSVTFHLAITPTVNMSAHASDTTSEQARNDYSTIFTNIADKQAQLEHNISWAEGHNEELRGAIEPPDEVAWSAYFRHVDILDDARQILGESRHLLERAKKEIDGLDRVIRWPGDDVGEGEVEASPLILVLWAEQDLDDAIRKVGGVINYDAFVPWF
jgi:hypothetical protein